MQFDTRQCKGVKRKWLPEPNPRKVEMPRKASLMNVFERAKEIYFHEECDVHDMQLADSSGMMIQVDDETRWTLEKYFDDNHYQPSRHKVYVMLSQDEKV